MMHARCCTVGAGYPTQLLPQLIAALSRLLLPLALATPPDSALASSVSSAQHLAAPGPEGHSAPVGQFGAGAGAAAHTRLSQPPQLPLLLPTMMNLAEGAASWSVLWEGSPVIITVQVR
jgi:hypothetical protein